MRVSTFTLAMLAVSTGAMLQLSAQENADRSCDVPLVVTRFVPTSRTVELVTDLTPKDLAVKVGRSPAVVKTASVDSGSKRVALILDASKKVPTDEWQLQTGMAISLLENARPLDRFVLFLVGVDSPAEPLVPLGDLQAQLRELSSSRPVAADDGERTYDALLAAAKRLDPPEFGDSIFLFGHPEDFGSKATPEQVEDLILRNRLRFYAMSFTDPLQGKLPAGFDPNKPLPKSVAWERADEIAHETGYFFSYHQIVALKFPGQMELLEGFLADLYAGIAKPYLLTIDMKVSGKTALDLTVANAGDRNIQQRDVHYPHFIYPCLSK